MRGRGLLVVGVALLGLGSVTLTAYAGVPHPNVVSTREVANTPQVVPTLAVPKPHVDAIATSDATAFAGGLFETVSESGSGSEYQRANVFAFNKATGAVSTTFNAQIAGGQVWAMAVDAATNSVYVGGSFKTVNGATRGALVKLDASTGARETAFKPPFASGQVNDLSSSPSVAPNDSSWPAPAAGN